MSKNLENMQSEFYELQTRLNNLNDFLNTETNHLDTAEYTMLNTQRTMMQTYLELLRSRILYEKNKNNASIDTSVKHSDNKNMTIGQAIEVIKRGGKCSRKYWVNDNKYIAMIQNITYMQDNGRADFHGNVIVLLDTGNIQLGWQPTQSDLLAEDWYIVE